MPVPFTNLPLPRWRCVPVHIALPDRERLEPVIAALPERIAPEAAADVTALLYGADLYNAGYFWEAHEVWEAVWSALPPNARERIACQALIQGANAFFQLATGHPKGFCRLVLEIEKLSADARSDETPLLGLALAPWRLQLQALAERVVKSKEIRFDFDPARIAGFPYLEGVAH